MNLPSQIESILFVASKPLSRKKIAKALEVTEHDVAEALEELLVKYNSDTSGIQIMVTGNDIQMATHPENADILEGFLRHEVAGELTRAQLETLTVVAYRGPITRPELEEIRGVNCAIILRNLMMRGLVEEDTEADKLMEAYKLTTAALSHLGIKSVEELPHYAELHVHAHIEEKLASATS